MSKPSLSMSAVGDINAKPKARQNQQKSQYLMPHLAPYKTRVLPLANRPHWDRSEVPANTPQMESPAADAPLCRSSRTIKPADRLDL
ncbi:hypothetical protein P5673_026771 [Acropora cervicornis]|uniref:Uncharacterized protein n=1 Tax=Acropora cervicornis TaxID=6130 RepID=A0AAD9UW69_ACRCE|nr:hypothetical protein P5673_026771 [Acropora cervicornis]